EGQIDFAAHLGGALIGVVAGLLLLRIWPRTSPEPRFGGAARIASIVGVVAYVAAFGLVSSHHAAWAVGETAELLPNDRLRELAPANARGLLEQSPHAPRVPYIAAHAAMNRGDAAAAERELRAALAERAVFRLHTFGEGKLEGEIRATLARLLEDQGRHDD